MSSESSVVCRNSIGGFYTPGKAFPKAKWTEIIEIYVRSIDDSDDGVPCSTSELARHARVSWNSAEKAILYYEAGVILNAGKKENQRSGIGSLTEGFNEEHNAYIYTLYRRNPSRPASSYISKLYRKYGIKVSHSFIVWWFKTIGPYKGTMQATSKFPPAKNTWQSLHIVNNYLSIMNALKYHDDVIFFADEKSLKDIDIYGDVRRDVLTGEVPTVPCNTNSCNQWNIMAACTARKGSERAFQYLMIEEHGTALIFRDFVCHLIKIDFLRSGDIFVIDNCTIHMSGENSELRSVLWSDLGILMIPLPPYHPDLNPIKLDFNDLVQHLKSMDAMILEKQLKIFYHHIYSHVRK